MVLLRGFKVAWPFRFLVALFPTAVVAGVMLSEKAVFEQEASAEIAVLLPLYSRVGWGYVDREGRWVIPPIYEHASGFSEGRALAAKDGRTVILNQRGMETAVLPEDYVIFDHFSSGLLQVQKGLKIGFINRDGKVVVPFEYDSLPYERVGGHQHGLAVVSKSGRIGAIDHQGVVVIPFEFDYIREFSDGVAIAKRGDEVGAINLKGEFVLMENDHFSLLERFVAGLAPAEGQNGKQGYVNKKGEWAVAPKYDFVDVFGGALGAVLTGDKVGFVNAKGEEVIAPRFSSDEYYGEVLAGSFSRRDGLCWVPLGNGKFGYINSTGQVVIDLGFTSNNDFDGGLALVWTDSEVGYIREDGTWLVRVAL